MAGIKQRLTKLEASVCSTGAPCPGAVLVLLFDWRGKPAAPIPTDAPRCALCGKVHLLRFGLSVVSAPPVERPAQRRAAPPLPPLEEEYPDDPPRPAPTTTTARPADNRGHGADYVGGSGGFGGYGGGW